MRTKLILIILLVVSASLLGQSGLTMTIRGRIVDLTTGSPIAYGEVSIVNKLFYSSSYTDENRPPLNTRLKMHLCHITITDKDGYYEISGIKAGEYDIWVKHSDGRNFHPNIVGESKWYEFEIKDGHNMTINIFLVDHTDSKVERKIINEDSFELTIFRNTYVDTLLKKK